MERFVKALPPYCGLLGDISVLVQVLTLEWFVERLPVCCRVCLGAFFLYVQWSAIVTYTLHAVGKCKLLKVCFLNKAIQVQTAMAVSTTWVRCSVIIITEKDGKGWWG